jgi:signal transduction histidine kinase
LAEAQRPEGIAALCRLILNFRLVSLLLTIVALPEAPGSLVPLFMALVAGFGASYLPLKLWPRIGASLMRHPAYLGADLVLAMGLLTLTGADSPFFYFTLGTAALSGVLYRRTGAAVFSVLLVVTYYVAFRLNPAEPGFTTLLGNPALYPLAAAGGAALRELIDRQAATEHALAGASRTAALEAERARISRDMHDSLAKTLHGMSLSASALAAWVRKDPDRAEAEAHALAEATREAAGEAREIIGGLRREELDQPLGAAIAAYVEGWSARTGVVAEARTNGADVASVAARWELFSVAREALDNVEAHAGAERVRVTLAEAGPEVVLEVADDGVGFVATGEPATNEPVGHFGLVGMAERAQKVGGSLTVESAPGAGATVRARVPSAGSEAAVGDRREVGAR